MKLKWSIPWGHHQFLRRLQFFLLLMTLCWGLIAASLAAKTTKTDVHSFSVEAARDSLLCVAYRLEGIPYRYGGKNEKGFDCSGYTRYIYQQIGIRLNASAATQYQQGMSVHADSLEQGDLLFFQHQNGKIFHVGMYVGEQDGRDCFIHASSSRGIVVDDLEQNYFRKRWLGARRIFNP